jgi:PHD/YefM family antitoxin component YafN of YafNO toxin-antitoxin module
MTRFSCSEVDLDVSKAKNAAQAGLVIITDRGRPSRVLMT